MNATRPPHQLTISRKVFVRASLGIAGGTLLGCSAESGETGPDYGAGGTNATGGFGTGTGAGTGTGGAGATGGTTTGGTGGATGGQNASGGTGGATGGQATGGTGGDATGGTGGGMQDACMADIDTVSSGESHQHRLVISMALIQAGVDTTIQTVETIPDNFDHCHEVTLTAADFATLKAGGVVKKITCSGGDHEFVISCAATTEVPVVPICADDDNTGACTMP